jgi:phospholipid transport system transporter-binding protein
MRKRSQSARPQKAGRARTKTGVFALPAECSVADGEALKDHLTKLLPLPRTVTLGRAAVQRIDTATLQMLAAFVRDRRARGLGFEWSGEAPAFTSAVSLLGLSSLL